MFIIREYCFKNVLNILYSLKLDECASASLERRWSMSACSNICSESETASVIYDTNEYSESIVLL